MVKMYQAVFKFKVEGDCLKEEGDCLKENVPCRSAATAVSIERIGYIW
jgi:hypothetical protein